MTVLNSSSARRSGGRGTALFIRNLGYRKSRHLRALTALILKKEPRCLLNIRVGGPESRIGRSGEEKNRFLLPGNQIPDRPATSALTSLSLRRGCGEQ